MKGEGFSQSLRSKLAQKMCSLVLQLEIAVLQSSNTLECLNLLNTIRCTANELESHLNESLTLFNGRRNSSCKFSREETKFEDTEETKDATKHHLCEIPISLSPPSNKNKSMLIQKVKKKKYVHPQSKPLLHLLGTMHRVRIDNTTKAESSFWHKMREYLEHIRAGKYQFEECAPKSSTAEQILSALQSLEKEKIPGRNDPTLDNFMLNNADESQTIEATYTYSFRKTVNLSYTLSQKARSLAKNAKQRYRQRVRWFIRPDTQQKKYYDWFIALLVVYSVVTVPVQLTFGSMSSYNFQALDVVIDVLFLVDVVIHFFTAQQEGGKLLYNHGIVMRKYLRGMFFFDFLGSFPFLQVAQAISSQNMAGFFVTKLARLVRLLRLEKLFRINRELSLGISQQHNSAVICLVSRMSRILLFAHLMACTWYAINNCHHDTDDWARCGNSNVAASKYIAALYFTTQTLMTVGYGDISVNTNAQRAFAVFVQLSGPLCVGIIVSSISEVMSSLDFHAKYMTEHLSALKVFTSEKKLPQKLRQKLHDHFVYFYSHTTVFPEVSIVQKLPPPLYQQLIAEQHSKHIDQFFLFKQCDITGHVDFVLSTLPLLKPMFSQLGDDILLQGDPPEELYFLKRGQVGSYVLENDEQVLLGIYCDGSTLNLENITTHSDMHCTLRAMSQSDMLWIHAEDFEAILEMFPAVVSLITEMAKTKLSNTLRCLKSATVLHTSSNHTMKTLVILDNGRQNQLHCCNDGPVTARIIHRKGFIEQPELSHKHQSVRVLRHHGRKHEFLRQKTAGKHISSRVLSFEMIEKEESHQSLTSKLLIHPQNKYKHVWDVIIFVFTLYSVFLIPVRIGFSLNAPGFNEFDVVVDSVYLFDIVVTFRTLHEVSPGLFFADSWIIAERYAKTWFVIDLMSSIPFTNFNTNSAVAARLVRVLRFLRFFKMMRVFKFLRLKSRVLHQFEGEAYGYYYNQLIQLSAFLLFLGHVLGCFWGFIALQEGLQNSWMLMVPSETFENLAVADVRSQYIASVYWAFTTLTTVGYGDIKPVSDSERAYSIFVMLVGGAVFAYVVGNVSNLVHQLTLLRTENKQRMYEVNEYLSEQSLGQHLSCSIKKQLAFVLCNHASTLEPAILEHLPAVLRRKTLLFSSHAAIKKIPIFCKASQTFVAFIFQRMVSEFCPAGSFIYKPDQCSKGLYFLTNGVVEEVEKSRAMNCADEYIVFCTVEVGSFFGHRKYLNLTKKAIGARANSLKDCDMYVLYTHELTYIDENFQSISKYLRGFLGKYFVEQHYLKNIATSRKRSNTVSREPTLYKQLKSVRTSIQEV